MYSLHKKGCGRSHFQAKQDNGVWSSSQQPNGNRGLARLEEDKKESKSEAGQETVSDVEVKMIDFAHVFPSDVPDQGYIYGLKNLLKVLHQILEEWKCGSHVEGMNCVELCPSTRLSLICTTYTISGVTCV